VRLVAVHGNGGGAFRFSRVAEHMPADVAIVAPDLPGFGGAPRDPSITTLAGFADALARIVRDVPRPRVVLGHGVGGSIALELLQREAELVDGVILHAPVGARLDRRWFPKLMRPRPMRELVRRVLASRLTRPFLRRRLFDDRVPREVVDGFFDGYAKCEAFGDLFDMIDATWFAGLAPVDVPAVLLWGERERVLGVDQVDAFRSLLPRASVEIVPEWDHFPMLETPREYAEVVARLARGLVPAPTRSASS
jgi:pimeloyl-ACP methyl ester carboxylesterase